MSSELSIQYHSLIFVKSNNDQINTWDDWHLVPTSRPLVNPPEPKENSVDVAGSNGKLDFTESLTGYTLYQNRTGSWEFMVMNGYDPWYIKFSEVMQYLHGRRMKVILEDDPSYYYIGRFKVNQWDSGEKNSNITIDYDLFPYKMEVTSSNEDWLWDPFDFEVGFVREYVDGYDENGNFINYLTIPAGETVNIDFDGNTMPVVPTIYVTSPTGSKLTVTYRNLTNTSVTKTLSDTDANNTNFALKITDPTMLLLENRKRLSFKSVGGDSTIKIDFRGGIL